MKRYAGITILLLVMSMFMIVTTGEVPGQMVATQEIGGAPPLPVDMQDFKSTKLEISPSYGNIRLKPGESQEIKFYIRNKETSSMKVSPKVAAAPFPGGNMIDSEWITITPASADIAASGNQKFTIKIDLPADASTGYYNTPIAITDEEFPSPYPSPFPNYVHTFSLSVDVWETPTIQLQNQYISDQVEAGKDYTYKIKIKNIGKEPIPLAPMIAEDDLYMSYGPYGSTKAFTNDAVTITAPKEIAAGGSAEVIVDVKVPPDSKGNYHAAIDLGLQDFSMQDPNMYRVQMDLWVWTQPTEPFVKTFSVTEAASLLIEVSSNIGMYGYPYNTGITKKKDPSFQVTLAGADNNGIQLKKTKTVIKGGVSLGGTMYAPWEMDGEGIYQETSVAYTETYIADVTPGEFKLGIMPQNTQQIEYTITVGGK